MRRHNSSPLRARYLLGALLAAALATTAVAHTDDSQDDQFLALVSAQGIPGADGQLIADGRAACDDYGSYTLLAQMYRLRDGGLSEDQARQVLTDGIKTYCPEKDGALGFR